MSLSIRVKVPFLGMLLHTMLKAGHVCDIVPLHLSVGLCGKLGSKQVIGVQAPAQTLETLRCQAAYRCLTTTSAAGRDHCPACHQRFCIFSAVAAFSRPVHTSFENLSEIIYKYLCFLDVSTNSPGTSTANSYKGVGKRRRFIGSL